MHPSRSLYPHHRFATAVIACAVRWYLHFHPSPRDVEAVLFERGTVVSYETIRRWCDKFGVAFARQVKAMQHNPGSTWHMDEVFVTLCGEPWVLWRAVDERGIELDILLQKRREKAAAKCFFRWILRSALVPRKIVTDELGSYPAAKAEIPELAGMEHVFLKAAAPVNSRAENSHQPAREREWRIRGSGTRRARAFQSCFGPIRQHFAIGRHLQCAWAYCSRLAARFESWRAFTVDAQNLSAAF